MYGLVCSSSTLRITHRAKISQFDDIDRPNRAWLSAGVVWEAASDVLCAVLQIVDVASNAEPDGLTGILTVATCLTIEDACNCCASGAPLCTYIRISSSEDTDSLATRCATDGRGLRFPRLSTSMLIEDRAQVVFRHKPRTDAA